MNLEPYKVGDVLPLSLGAEDMRRAFPVKGRAMSPSRFYELERAGKFRRFELASITGGPKRWSGLKVARFYNGDSFSVAVRRTA